MLSQVMFICTVFIGTLAQLIWNNSGDQLKKQEALKLWVLSMQRIFLKKIL